MKRSSSAIVAIAAPAAMLFCAAALPQTSARRATHTHTPPPHVPDTFHQSILPVISTYCVGCHSGDSPAAGISFAGLKSAAAVSAAEDTWTKVARNIASGHMPPPGAPHPTEAQRKTVAQWIDHALAAPACDVKDPGRVTMRRLNRAEYNNTVHDLLGIDFQPAADFPNDDVGYGFDNIGDVLTVSPLLMEKYVNAAEKIASDVMAKPELKARLIPTEPPAQTQMATARRLLTGLAQRAYRRPATTADVERLMRCVYLAQKEGDSFDSGMQLALEAALVSPDFLFRVELHGPGLGAVKEQPVNDYELASRLSYFLWSTMPDGRLFNLAARHVLHTPKVMAAEVKRMLADPKSVALAANFAGQWLQLRKLNNVFPDRQLFPNWNRAMRGYMQTETEKFFQSVVSEDRSILDLLDGRYTYLNGPLAHLYGIAGVDGEDFRRVELTGDERGGVLRQASVLTVTSNPTRTSPVKRGKWVMEELLGTPPPPQPPNIPPLEQTRLTGTLRQKMEEHRKNPACASCHKSMDPIGFGLENYDAIGEWRTMDGKDPVDSSGTLPDGRTFKGPDELIKILMVHKEQFVKCLTEKLLIYALGRGLESYDRCAVNDIVARVTKDNYKFSALASAIAESEPFLKQRGGRA